MRRYLIIIMLMMTALSMRAAEKNILAGMVDVPFEVMPYLQYPQFSRMALRYEVSNGLETDTVENYFGGRSYVKQFDRSQRLLIAVADGVDFDFHFVGDPVYLLRHYCAPLCSSSVSMYTTLWQKISDIVPPDNMLFPLAELIDGQVVWTEQKEDEQPVIR